MKVYRFRELDSGGIEKLCRRNPLADPSVMETCRSIFEEVAQRKDAAVREYTARFDGVELIDFEVSRKEFSEARKRVAPECVKALERAARNIRKFHASQQIRESPVEVEAGVYCWRESRAIDCVGLYIPGGTAVLPSTVLMLGIPARLAGCREIVLCMAPRKDGSVSPEALLAAESSAVSRVFKIGGAQAIAAMSLGTETVPKVDKILGPGNRWVQGAKLLATLRGTAIDLVAGPTEVLVIADETAQPSWVAADLVSQAEHGSDSRAVLVATSERIIKEVTRLVWQQVSNLPRREFAEETLKASFCLLVDDLEEALDFANRFAPEHLILQVRNPKQWVEKITSAGSVFLGPWSPEVAGDYASGTNHTLPTSGLARAFSGVSLDTFLKKITFQELTQDGLARLAPTLETLAQLEGLEGHRRAVRIRLENCNRNRWTSHD